MLIALFLAVASFAPGPQATPAAGPAPRFAEPVRLVVASDGSGDFQGSDHTTIQGAIDALPATGGTVVIRAGQYWVRHTLRLRSGVHLVGEPGTELRQPAPKLVTTAAQAGDTRLVLDNVVGVAAGTALQLLPPEGIETFDGLATMIQFVVVTGVDEHGVTLDRPLPFAIQAHSRFGYPFKMIWASQVTDVSITGIAFEGGKRAGMSMPGHHQRSAIWVDSLYSKREGPVQAPSSRASVRACSFRNFYGRGVAFYNVVDSEIVGCSFVHINDEAIDFDHYCYRCKASGNEIIDALWGVAINDASDCLVEGNHLRDCDIGITIWWLPALDPTGLNEHNIVRGNFVRGSRQALAVLKNARRNVLEENFLEGAVIVVESDNQLAHNTITPKGQ